MWAHNPAGDVALIAGTGIRSETAASGQVGARRWMAQWCTREVCGDGVTDQRQGEVNVGFFSHVDFEPIGAARSQADLVVRLELRAASRIWALVSLMSRVSSSSK